MFLYVLYNNFSSHKYMYSIDLVDASRAINDDLGKWKIQVDEKSSLATFSLISGGSLGVKNKMLTLIQSPFNESCQWMITPVDDQYIKILNVNGRIQYFLDNKFGMNQNLFSFR